MYRACIMRRISFFFVIAMAMLVGAFAAEAAPRHGTAKYVITRTKEVLYVGGAAVITVNGESAGLLWVGQTTTGTLPAGPTEITASSWLRDGKSSVKFTAQPGRTYRFTVAPRGEHFVVGMVAGVVGTLIEGNGAFSIVPTK